MDEPTKPSSNGPLLDGIQTKALDNGNVEFCFFGSGKQVAKAQCTPTELSGLVSGLLSSSYYAFHDNQGASAPPTKQVVLPSVVPTTQWFLGHTNVSGQRALAVQVGESVIGFSVTDDQMRDFGRLLISTSWRARSTTSSAALLRLLLKEFFEDLRAWAAIVKSRIRSAYRRRLVSSATRISGRSLRIFRSIEFAPNVGFRDYEPMRRCVYCGATVYSERAGVRRHPLGAEHIVPEGLGGTLVLPEASCQRCEETTGAVVENDVLGLTLKALRIHLEIRGKRRRPVPTALPLTRTDRIPEEQFNMPVADYPVILCMPAFGRPGVFTGGAGGNQTTIGFKFVILHYDEKKLRKVYGVSSFATPRWDTHMLFRMLAKIGHSFAAAELGENFLPLLGDMICNGTPDLFNHIGGEPDLEQMPASDALHEIGLGYQRANGKDYVVARVRLFAKHGAPIYYVVVGESREGQLAKLRRLSSWQLRKIR